MNVYDSAHALASAIKESDDYKVYKELSDEIKTNESLTTMLKDFQTKQIMLQKSQIMGEPLDQSEVDKAQELYDVMTKDPKMEAYFESEMKISQILGDVSKIISDAMELS